MKFYRFILLCIFGCLCLQDLQAQRTRAPKKKDTPELSCLLLAAVEAAPEKSSQSEEAPDLKLVISSVTDTTVKACIDGVVSTIQRDTDGTYEVVFYHDDYWFWLSGLSKVSIRKNANIKNGQAIGMVEPGKKIELLMFAFETPVDPKDYLNCEIKPAQK